MATRKRHRSLDLYQSIEKYLAEMPTTARFIPDEKLIILQNREHERKDYECPGVEIFYLDRTRKQYAGDPEGFKKACPPGWTFSLEG